MKPDQATREAMRAAQGFDAGHREENPAQRAQGAPVSAAMLTGDPLNPGAEWAALVRPFGPLVAMLVPEAATAYTGPAWDRATAEFGAALQAVALKRGWTVDTLPEVALAFAAFQLAAPAALALHARRTARQRAAERPPAPPPAPPPPPADNPPASE